MGLSTWGFLPEALRAPGAIRFGFVVAGPAADVVQGSLSPTVTPISGTDTNGYQATDPPVWDDPLAYAAGTRVWIGSFLYSRFDVEFADPLTCPAPLLVFSDDDSPTIVDLG